MTQVQLLASIGGWLVNIVFAVSALFPAVTAAYWRWWDSWWGRNIVGLEVCIAATLLPAVLFRDFHVDVIGLRWVQVVSLAAVAVFIIWRAVMIWRTQRQGGLDWLATTRPTGLHEGPHPTLAGCGPSFRVYPWHGQPHTRAEHLRCFPSAHCPL